MNKIKTFFKKLRNWIVFGEFVELFLVTCKCDDAISTIVVKADDKYEAAILASTELKSKYNCTNFTIIEINKY